MSNFNPDWKILPIQHDQELVNSMIDRVAEAWASIDGKLDLYHQCQEDQELENKLGHHQGYIADAQELLQRSALIPATMHRTWPEN